MDEITFGSSLMGFNREQVLHYIDEISAQKVESQAQRERESEQARTEQKRLEEEKDRLKREVEDLRDERQNLRTQLEALEAERNTLQEKLTRASCEASDFKQRLFQREQDFLNLKKTRFAVEEDKKRVEEQLTALQETKSGEEEEKAALQQQLAKAQAERDKALQECARQKAACEKALQQLDQQKAAQDELATKLEAGCRDALTRAKNDYAQKLSATESELEKVRGQLDTAQRESDVRLSEIRMELLEKAAAERDRMKQGAAAINQGVADLRAKLNQVDESIFHVTKELENATQPIYDVLDEAETNAHRLEGQMQRFPYGCSISQQPKTLAVPQPKVQPAPEAKTHQDKPGKQPENADLDEQKRDLDRRVESLLERLNEILKDS